MSSRFWTTVVVLALGAAAAVGCFPEGNPLAGAATAWDGGVPEASTGGQGGDRNAGGEGGSPEVAVRCAAVETPEALVPRANVMSEEAGNGSEVVFVSDLFQVFKTQCGGCHVESDAGGLKVSLGSFPVKVGEEAIERMKSDDLLEFMPPLPTGMPWSERPEGDAVKNLVTLLEQWMQAGRPGDVFVVDGEASDGSLYLMTPAAGQALTNLGTCLPEQLLFVGPKSEELDAMFAALVKKPPGEGTPAERVGLPESLADTDLFSFDSAELQQYGVVAFAPNYPLWSDGSGKLRHVRVPKGESIRYDAERREFEIPENTRFYKTFFKKVIDRDGNEAFRKIETRLIVARQDSDNADGSTRVNALFGSYAWNEDETEAILVTDPLRNGEPFRDRLFTYISDEPRAAAVQAQEPRPPNLSYALEAAGAVRHYAIPGAERCVQCHMGSISKSFVLGFTPLQINRLEKGVQGTYEESSADELGQLERLVDLGVITGLDPEHDVTLLAESQGERPPRNEHELAAQAYMLGNCAHCHNPRGYPSVINPALAPLLSFWPGDDTGIFQFPLDRMSPRTARGPSGETPIPYITPSLRDITGELLWARKYNYNQPPYVEFVDAPWRSLIYRNVDTPFTYADDYAIFPHMPMNTAGFDCRVPRLMAEWMVSVPSVRVHPELNESAILSGTSIPPGTDNTPQPYVEVRPDEEGYDVALIAAEKRLADYRAGQRYGYCPDTSDIVDPAVQRGETITPRDQLQSVAEGEENPNPTFVDPLLVMSVDGVPDRAHFAITDFTEVPGEWFPRRSDWANFLKDQEWEPLPATADQLAQNRRANEQQVVAMLQDISVDSIVDFALTERPMGFWKPKEECAFGSVPAVADFTGDERPEWMQCENAPGKPSSCDDAPVFMQLPGAHIYTTICSNCHGLDFDAQGIQAKTVGDLTGGVARVANFRKGLFGPEGDAGSNRKRVFGDVEGGSADDWASRYLTWMGLGGTMVTIPDAVMGLVLGTPVLGENRPNRIDLRVEQSANMLAGAQELCRMSLLAHRRKSITWDDVGPWFTALYEKTPLLTTNGDARHWLEVCSFDNPPPVRAFKVYFDKSEFELYDAESFFSQQGYPNAPVGNHLAAIDDDGVHADNLFPWCLVDDADGQAFAASHTIGGKPLPLCPAGLEHWAADLTGTGLNDDFEPWLMRGAINAGLTVFVYVDQVTRGNVVPTYYDRCEAL
jgi:mono/diheme cytochrome c family protein